MRSTQQLSAHRLVHQVTQKCHRRPDSVACGRINRLVEDSIANAWRLCPSCLIRLLIMCSVISQRVSSTCFRTASCQPTSCRVHSEA